MKAKKTAFTDDRLDDSSSAVQQRIEQKIRIWKTEKKLSRDMVEVLFP